MDEVVDAATPLWAVTLLWLRTPLCRGSPPYPLRGAAASPVLKDTDAGLCEGEASAGCGEGVLGECGVAGGGVSGVDGGC